MQSQISSWLLMGCACLLQNGFYSVLDTNMAAALYTMLFSCRACATRLHRPNLCATQCMTQKDSFMLLYSNKTKISLYQDAVGFGSDMFTTLFQCRGSWALWWSMDIYLALGCVFFCLWGALFNPIILKLKVEVFYNFLCACLLKGYNCVHAFQIIWPSPESKRKATESQGSAPNEWKEVL